MSPSTAQLDPEEAPAEELAALYHQRWEVENAFDELKVHLRGPGVVLWSRTLKLVRQEFYGFLLAHYAVRDLMHEAALEADLGPDTVSFTHTVRVVRWKLPRYGAYIRLQEAVLEEVLKVPVSSRQRRHNPRAVKRKMSKYPTKHRNPQAGTVRRNPRVRIVSDP